MSNALIWIAVIGVLAWLWLDGARAREMAIGIAEGMCRKRGLQFLDQTVNLQRMGLRRTADGLRIRRMFGFDFSVEGMGRRSGYLILVGTRVEQFELGLPKPSESGSDPQPGPPIEPPRAVQPGDKVVPFKRPPKR